MSIPSSGWRSSRLPPAPPLRRLRLETCPYHAPGKIGFTCPSPASAVSQVFDELKGEMRSTARASIAMASGEGLPRQFPGAEMAVLVGGKDTLSIGREGGAIGLRLSAEDCDHRTVGDVAHADCAIDGHDALTDA